MNARKSLILAAAISCSFATTAAFAQFHLPKALGGSSASAGSSSNGSPEQGQDALVKSFVASQTEVLRAQSLLAQAYGLKDQAKLCSDQANALQSTSVDTDTLKKTVEVSDQANEQISSEQQKQSALSAEEKQYYADSLPHFAKGVIGTHDVIEKAASFTSSMKGSAMSMGMGMTKLKSGMYVAKATPSYSKSLFDVFRKTMEISHTNGVKTPSDATAALGSLD